MIILDTNVVSALMQPRRNSRLDAWVRANESEGLFICVTTVYEIEFGLARLRKPEPKRMLHDAWNGVLRQFPQERILVVDRIAAKYGAEIKAGVTGTRDHADNCDCLLAGVAITCQATLATRNLKHFPRDRLKIVDPWTD